MPAKLENWKFGILNCMTHTVYTHIIPHKKDQSLSCSPAGLFKFNLFFSQWQNWMFKSQWIAERHSSLLFTIRSSRMNCSSVLHPLSATGKHKDTLHTIGTARYLQAPFLFKLTAEVYFCVAEIIWDSCS